MTATTMAGRATVTATSSRPVLRHPMALASARAVAGALASAVAVTVSVAACASSTSPAGVSVASAAPGTAPPGRPLSARPAPAAWHRVALPGGAAVLAFPPAMHLVAGDAGAVTAASFSPSGAYVLYLNATPRQGAETLADWPAFRVGHQRADNAASVRLLAVRHGVRFLGGTGTCVVDAYVTKVRANHYTELACFVRGRTSASVIVAAAPTARWTIMAGLLARAVAAYQAR